MSALTRDLKNYSKEKLKKDIIAGVFLGIIAAPLSMALSIASGMTASMGLYTAAIGGFICALLGGSSLQISGPTGAFVSVVLGIVNQYGFSGIFIASFMSGIILILIGLLGGGKLLKYIPYAITLGFSSGIAVIILTTQINDFFGLSLKNIPTEFIQKWTIYIKALKNINFYAFFIAISVVLIIFLLPKLTKKVPEGIVALLFATFLNFWLKLPVETISSVFGKLDTSFPKFIIPNFALANELLPSALTLTFIGAISTLLSASVVDFITDDSHNSKEELVAQGVSNIFMSFFGLFPISGEVARSCNNAAKGAKTPVSAIIHSITVLFITICIIPFAGYVPMSALAGLLFTVCFNMINWESIKNLKNSPKSDVLIFLTVFLITITKGLMLAIEVGIVLTAILFLKHMAGVTEIRQKHQIPDDLKGKMAVYHIEGPMFFPVVDRLIHIYENYITLELIIIDFEFVSMIDLTAIRAINTLVQNCKKHKTDLYFTCLKKQPLEAMKKAFSNEILFKESVETAILDFENSKINEKEKNDEKFITTR